mmetsp:Transcript_3093/g.5432  ORF Transcript_3093/g.5432 Transcript_3093/m.5432 type:complete len:627 (-) Transcript_3093:161-2041(-)
MALWDTAKCNLVTIDDEKLNVVYSADAVSSGVAVGTPVMKDDEEHSYTVILNKSKMNDGAGIWIGLQDVESGKAWGLHPSDGKIFRFEKTGGKMTEVCTLRGVGLAGKGAKGATIKMEVNMKLKKVYYSINGSPPLDIDVRLPKTVLPWAQFMWGEASLTLSDYLGPLERGALKDRIERSMAAAEREKARAEEAERRVAEAEKWKSEMQAMLEREPDSDLVRRLKGRIGELEVALKETEEALVAKKEEVKMIEEAAKPVEVKEDPRVAELTVENARLKREIADLKAGGAFADERVDALSTENTELKEEVGHCKEEAKFFRDKAWAAEEQIKQLLAKTRDLETKDTEIVAGVAAGQSASEQIVECPPSAAIAPLIMFGAKAEQGGGDFKVTAVGTVEVKMLMDVWQSEIENRYVIRRVEGIQVTDELKDRFQNKTRAIDSQYAQMKATKQDTFPDPDGDKAKILAKLAKKYTRTDGLGHAKLLIAFHGCDPRAANKICSEGFAMTKKDSRYGVGCKMSTCAAQVCRALVNTEGITRTSEGEYVLLVAWAVPGPVYPISRATDYKPDQAFSKWANNRLKPPFMAHYACIGADGEALSGSELEGPTDDVMIIQAHEQILPAYRIYFTEK